MKCNTVYGCLTEHLCRNIGKCAQGPSERATPKTAGPVKVVAAVATGSLAVSSVNLLINRWEGRARDHRQIAASNDSMIMAAAHTVIADKWDEAVNDLRAEMVRAMVRQPEENIKAQTRAEDQL